MTTTRQRQFTITDVESIMRASEYRPTTFRSGQDGHTFSNHIGISNSALIDRWLDRYRRSHNNGILAITAFNSNHDAFRTAMDVLNTTTAADALDELATRPTGTRVAITCCLPAPVSFRYVLAGRTVANMSWPWFRMVVDSTGVGRHGIHIQTFFALLSERPMVGWQRQE